MVVGHNIKHGSNVGYASRKDARRAEKKFSVSVTNRPASQGEFNMESEMEASGRRIDLEQAREDENHNQEVLNHRKYLIEGDDEGYNDEEVDRASEVDEEVIAGTSMDDYENHLHPITRSIFQQLSTSEHENVERVMDSNYVQLYMPNAIRSCRMRRINYSPWGYNAPSHGDIVNITQGNDYYSYSKL